MKPISLILVIFTFFFSCEEKEIEFVQSESIERLILLRHPPMNDSVIKKRISTFLLNDSIVKKQISTFLLKETNSRYSGILFYRYNYKTSYFIDNKEDPGGFSSEELINYPEYEIATYIISKCENDTTKFMGEFIFYGLEGSSEVIGKIDTLINNCR